MTDEFIPFPKIPEAPTTKVCLGCRVEKPIGQFSPRAKGRLGCNTRCKPCASEEQTRRYRADPAKYRAMANGYRRASPAKHALASAKYRTANPHKKLIEGARFRARRDGLTYSITEADLVVPVTCPVLGIPLIFGRGKLHDGSPSVDRVDPTRGYEAGNVRVISHRANRLKSDASVRELRLVLEYMEAHHV